MQNKHLTFFSLFGGPTYGKGGGPLAGPNAKLFPKINFDGPPYLIFWIVMGCGIADFGWRGLKNAPLITRYLESQQ